VHSGETYLNSKGNVEPSADDNGGNTQGKRKGRRRWRFAAFFLTFLVVVVLGLGGVLAWKLKSLGFQDNVPIVQKTETGGAITPPPSLEPADSGAQTDSPDDMVDVNLAVGKTPIYAQPAIDPNIMNILVIGLDSNKPGGNGRDDVNMVVSIDRKNNTIKLVSLLRDTLVPIEGHDWNRLNSTYAFGGPGLTINTINKVYKLDIQRYVKIDFFALQDIIDAVGGVDVILKDKEITYLRSFGFNVSRGAGVKHLDGKTALAYSRIREIDTDFQRTQRQRNVLSAALGRTRALGVVQAIDLMNKLLPEVKTNISTGDAISLAREVIGMGNQDMKQMTVPVINSFTNSKYKGMLILSVDFTKNSQSIRDFLYTNK
jgi:LCP family protein required for cell wall assembly